MNFFRLMLLLVVTQGWELSLLTLVGIFINGLVLFSDPSGQPNTSTHYG